MTNLLRLDGQGNLSARNGIRHIQNMVTEYRSGKLFWTPKVLAEQLALQVGVTVRRKGLE